MLLFPQASLLDPLHFVYFYSLSHNLKPAEWDTHRSMLPLHHVEVLLCSEGLLY